MATTDPPSALIDWQVGRFLTIENNDGTFSVASIADIDNGNVLLKLYTRRFSERPAASRRDDLSPRALNEAGEPAMTIALQIDVLRERQPEPLELSAAVIRAEQQGRSAARMAVSSLVALGLIAGGMCFAPDHKMFTSLFWPFVVVTNILAIAAVLTRRTGFVLMISGLVFLIQFAFIFLVVRMISRIG